MASIAKSETEAWLALAAFAAIFLWFHMRMVDGWTIVDQSAGKLLWTYFAVVTLSTVAAFAAASIARLLAGGRIVDRDERDLAIEARANGNERLFVIAAVNVLIWQALWEAAMPDHTLPRIDLARLPTLFYCLFAVLFGGDIVKRVSTIWLYRAQSARG